MTGKAAVFVVRIFVILLCAGFCCCLRCFHCGGSSDLTCKHFNSSRVDLYSKECPVDFKACSKGWVNGDRSERRRSSSGRSENPLEYSNVVRGCTRVAVDSCLLQNAGGACTCVTELCNGAHRRTFVFPLFHALPFLVVVWTRRR